MTRPLYEKARDYTDKALATINEIMEDPFAEDKDRLKAATEILDRGHGKATQAVIALPPNQQQAQEAAKLTRQQLLEIIQRTELPRLRHEAEVVDAEYETVDPLLR